MLLITLIANTETQILNETILNKFFTALEKKKGRIQDFTWLSVEEAADIRLRDIKEEVIHEAAEKIFAGLAVDVIVQVEAHRQKKFLICDMDSTIIQQECIDELADELGIKPKVADITERAMNGELDFVTALKERVALLKGLDELALERVYKHRITLMPGAKTLVSTMKKNGAKAILVSGGFTFFTTRVAMEVGFDRDVSNNLVFEAGHLTGEVGHPIVDKETKKTVLEAAIKEENYQREEILAVGDGANDLPMLKAAGLGVAYHAKPHVRAQTKAQLNHNNLQALLFVQGYKKPEWI